jgi:hypothetical protein
VNRNPHKKSGLSLFYGTKLAGCTIRELCKHELTRIVLKGPKNLTQRRQTPVLFCCDRYLLIKSRIIPTINIKQHSSRVEDSQAELESLINRVCIVFAEKTHLFESHLEGCWRISLGEALKAIALATPS